MDTETAVPPPEARLIRAAREAAGLTAAKAAGKTGGVVSPVYWRDVERGTGGRRGERVPVRGSARVIAHMALAVTLTPDRLETEGERPDAADVLREILRSRQPDAPEGTIDPSLQAARARADTSDPDAAPDVLFPGDPARQDMWRVITDPGMPADEKLAALAGPALFPGDRAKQAIVAADIIGREKPAEMAAKIRVLDRMRDRSRERAGHREQSA
jgi:transcriptional regulator with XRE-family HTH domain